VTPICFTKRYYYVSQTFAPLRFAHYAQTTYTLYRITATMHYKLNNGKVLTLTRSQRFTRNSLDPNKDPELDEDPKP